MNRLRHFFYSWQNGLGLLLVSIFVFMAISAPMLSPMSKKDPGIFQRVGRASDNTPYPPSQNAPLGTLPGQVDVFHSLIWGAGDALKFGLTVALGAFVFGVLIGAVAGYAGGALSGLLMRTTDAFLTFPMIAGVVFLQEIVASTIVAMGGIYWFNNPYQGTMVYLDFTPPVWVSFLMKVDPLLICLILFLWMPYARLTNTMVTTLKRIDFVQASQAMGGSSWWVISRHLIPNSLSPAIVMAARDVGSAVVLQATFTFIGMGGNSAWGKLLSFGRDWVIGPGGDLLAYWWTFLPATLALVFFGIGWNLLGDGLNELLDPYSR